MWCVVMGAVALASEVEVSDEDASAPSSVPLNVTPKQSLNRAMWTLNTWAVTNIATGIPLSLTLEDPQQAAFYQMNAGWNATLAEGLRIEQAATRAHDKSQKPAEQVAARRQQIQNRGRSQNH